MKKYGIFVLFCCIYFLIFSCSTLQEDIEVYSAPEEESPEILELEKEIVFLEANKFRCEEIDLVKTQEITKTLDKMSGSVNLQNIGQAKLLGFQGRVALLDGKKSLAKSYYEQAVNTYKGEVQSVILGFRLGLVENLENQFVAKNYLPLLILENAISAYQREDYLEAVAKFDEAFISLESYYHEAYELMRNKAWKLREISSDSVVSETEILKQDNMNLLQMLTFTQNTTDLLFKYTASKKYAGDAFVNQIILSGLLNALNAMENLALENLSKDTVVTRILAARFLWNLYLDRRGMSGQVVYAEQFIAAGFSPIKDLPLDSPDFDAVLGCVEKEIMELVDGENFYPEEPIEPVEFSTSLKKIK